MDRLRNSQILRTARNGTRLQMKSRFWDCVAFHDVGCCRTPISILNNSRRFLYQTSEFRLVLEKCSSGNQTIGRLCGSCGREYWLLPSCRLLNMRTRGMVYYDDCDSLSIRFTESAIENGHPMISVKPNPHRPAAADRAIKTDTRYAG